MPFFFSKDSTSWIESVSAGDTEWCGFQLWSLPGVKHLHNHRWTKTWRATCSSFDWNSAQRYSSVLWQVLYICPCLGCPDGDRTHRHWNPHEELSTKGIHDDKRQSLGKERKKEEEGPVSSQVQPRGTMELSISQKWWAIHMHSGVEDQVAAAKHIWCVDSARYSYVSQRRRIVSWNIIHHEHKPEINQNPARKNTLLDASCIYTYSALFIFLRIHIFLCWCRIFSACTYIVVIALTCSTGLHNFCSHLIWTLFKCLL